MFHNDGDFQFSLSWNIKSIHPNLTIRLEKAIYSDGETAKYIDIILSDEKKENISIELKYITSRLVTEHVGESFYLKAQSGNDIRCYDTVKGLQRLEKFVKMNEIA